MDLNLAGDRYGYVTAGSAQMAARAARQLAK
jgi:hypothetical protein